MHLIHQVMRMARFSRGMALRPINRIKHVVDSQQGIVGGAVQDFVLVNTVDTPLIANVANVETGSKVNGFFLVIELTNTEGTQGVIANAYLMVFKNPGANLTFPNPNVVGADDNKKYVFHQEMVMLQKVTNSNPRTLFKGVITIPRHLRRNGPSDQIVARVFSPAIDLDACMQCHYKEFR